MKQQQLQIYMSSWAFPLAIPIINGVGRIFAELGLLESAMVISWICRTPSPLTKSENNETKTISEISQASVGSIDAVSDVQEDTKES